MPHENDESVAVKGQWLKPKPCGTLQAFYQHKYLKQKPCAACREAFNVYRRARYKPRARSLMGCGTEPGYRAHLKKGEAICEPCRRAKNEVHRLKKFGLKMSQAQRMLAFQRHLCAVCATPIDFTNGQQTHIDHDHRTGLTRGIVCQGCNVGLGGFRDDPQRLEAAIRYLERATLRQGVEFLMTGLVGVPRARQQWNTIKDA